MATIGVAFTYWNSTPDQPKKNLKVIIEPVNAVGHPPFTSFFEYISIEAAQSDSFFIVSEVTESRFLSPLGNTGSVFFTRPGYFEVRIEDARQKKLGAYAAHILSDGMACHLEGKQGLIIPLNNEETITEDFLYPSPEKIKSAAKIGLGERKSDSIWTKMVYAQESDIQLDNISISFRLRALSSDLINQKRIIIKLIGENHSNIGFTFSEPEYLVKEQANIGSMVFDRTSSQQTNLNHDFSTFRQIDIQVRSMIAALSVDDDIAFSSDYSTEFGAFKALEIHFEGTGAIDDLIITSPHRSQPLYENHFQ